MTPDRLTIEASWLLNEARTLAASTRLHTFGPVAILAAALRADTTFGAALRAAPVGSRTGEISDFLTKRASEVRVPVRRVQPTSDVEALLLVAAKRAAGDARENIDAEDIVWALTIVPGPHTRFFGGEEAAARDTFARRAAGGGAGSPWWKRTPPARLGSRWRRTKSGTLVARSGRIVWATWKLVVTYGSGAAVIVAGAGIVLHHAAVQLLAAVFRFRASFVDWTEHLGGRLDPSRALSTRETIVVIIVVRTALAVISIGTFAALFLEFKGLGLSPWPEAGGDLAEAFGPATDLDVNVLAHLLNGPRPLELWIAIGTAFLSIPPFDEVDRLHATLRLGKWRARFFASFLWPLRGVTFLFHKFDKFTGYIGFPTMLSSGMIGTVACAISGSTLAEIMLLAAT